MYKKYIGAFQGERFYLSNMYPSPIVFDMNGYGFECDGLTYPSSENLYQALKCIHKEDRIKFTKCSPMESKKLGRKLVAIRRDWDEVKDNAMKLVLALKFDNPSLREKLTNETQPIEELNNWGDTYWGKCFDEKQQKWIGEDKLGKFLTQERSHKSIIHINCTIE